jgi:hypothetical protein
MNLLADPAEDCVRYTYEEGRIMTEPSRTKLDFTYKGDITAVVDQWAKENHFKVSPNADGSLACRRGGGVMMCAVILEVRQTGEQVHLETWLAVDILTEFASLFTAPQESAIQSGETLLWREKELARWYVNPLLERLEQPPIS